ncbi:MAG: hypothetical protein A2W22_04215 [Candidatus Levybacteria bacterium RBG_16_35_11]|nr:MAG: hypothetical protein A2W22_04215 [Candidatus Levybacteria bacterium RBG_16_35_11]
MPEDPGVYLFQDRESKVIYVGKARNLKKRVRSYFIQKNLGIKTSLLVSQIKKIKTVIVNSEIESLLLEANFIKKYQPKFNIKLTDGKSYPLIRITIKEKFPKILTARRMENNKSIYFGPYPNAGAMKMVLKTIRRIFPYESVKNHPKKTCLYYHIGLCPCCEALGDGEYRKNIRRIIKFLNGQTKNVILDLEKERNLESKEENYEKASLIQKRIEAIKYVTSPVYKPQEYEFNVNLISDIRERERVLLQKTLNDYGIPIEKLERIECFDVSNIHGNLVTGSMVVFENGEPQKSGYRRFRVRSEVKGKPNDVLAMEEIIKRRLKYKEWQKPDLIIVDGGKGQVSAAMKVLKEENIDISVIGLAKREETIITPSLRELKLPRNNPGLYLIMRIRDEAHRFAITYHRKLRSKALFR